MRRSLPVLVFVIGFALLGGTAAAETYVSKAGKVSVAIPKGWPVTATDELVRAVSANNEVAVVMWVVDSPDVKEGLKRLEQELYSSVQSLRWVNKPRKVRVNRLRGTFVEGVGMSARATQLDVLVFIAGPTPAKKGVIVMGVVDHDKLPAYKRTIQTIFQSLKPTK